ncbi:MAG TPA: M23 family metallopeptidase [Acidobacteriota bacterium]|nr:M23 family metallopeptidase [Acidobacteriota bacterium]
MSSLSPDLFGTYEVGLKRWSIVAIVLSLTFVVPAALCVGLMLVPLRSLLTLIAALITAACLMTILILVNWWEFTSICLRWVWAAALLAAALLRVYVQGPEVDISVTPATIALAVLAAFGLWLLGCVLSARRPAGEAIELAFPLEGGKFLVTDGGDGARSFLVNYHFGFGRHRASGVNASMQYALDVVRIGSDWCESRGYFPRSNQKYHIWGSLLHAPCEGLVVHAVNDVKDNAAFGDDRPYGVGNHAVIRMDETSYVVLGHIQCGSVRVAKGDTVRTGDIIGRVGNSGWSERPHLHMQAMRATNSDWWHGSALPIRFNGRFLVRNQVVRN